MNNNNNDTKFIKHRNAIGGYRGAGGTGRLKAVENR